MPNLFFDTSAISKHYHAEIGSPEVDALLGRPGVSHIISRLSVVELHSAFAKKVRTGQLTLANFQKLTRRFRGDVSAKRLKVIRLTATHFLSAERLIRRLGPKKNLRTLDAIQLAIALNLNATLNPTAFVCADVTLCTIAADEALAVINPEIP